MSYLEFKNPQNLIYIILPLACSILFILGYAKKDKILKVLRLKPSSKLKYLRFTLICIGLALMFFSLLGPQTFIDYQKVEKKGLDIYVLMDTSKSMLAEDIKPNRLSRAKKIIENLIDQLEGDRIGFIPYSSSAFIQMPLTDDYQLARMFLKVIDTDMIGGGGTNAGAAINLAANSFDQTSSSDRVLIVLSDGEEHESDTMEVLKKLKDKNMKIYSIGVGTDKGSLIPVYDDTGKKKQEYKKDEAGQVVNSKLDSSTLEKIAGEGNGSYFQSTSSGMEIGLLLKDISSLKRDTMKTDKVKRYNQIYQYFLGLGIIMFIIAYILPERRKQE